MARSAEEILEYAQAELIRYRAQRERVQSTSDMVRPEDLWPAACCHVLEALIDFAEGREPAAR